MNNWNLELKKKAKPVFTYEVTVSISTDCDDEGVIAGIFNYADYMVGEDVLELKSEGKISYLDVESTGAKFIDMEPEE